MASSISSSFTEAAGAFEELNRILLMPGCPVQDQLSPSALEDELGRFKVWAGNIAAHKVGRASLDFRLRDATPLRERIAGLLRDMEILIQEVMPVVAGERLPRDEMTLDSDSSDAESTTAREGYASDEDSSHQSTELQQMFSDVVAIINSLFRLSMTIRNAAPHDRLVKAASVDTTFYEKWDIEHVKNKFPNAKEFLSIRLGRAITKRRQYLKYMEKHRRKLAQDVQAPKHILPRIPQREVTIANPTAVDAAPAPLEGSVALSRSEPTPSVVATTILTQTTASEFTGGNVEFDAESDSGQTQTSYATSVGHGGKLSLPPLPKEARNEQPFECRYCFTIISIKSSHFWKKHIFRDLQPYVCTFEACAKAGKMFDARHEWFEHELLVHRKEWFCSADCQVSFSVLGDFEDHMRKTHAETFSENQLSAIAEMCQRPVDENAETQCSLCLETVVSMKQLCRHLARHLEVLALFALPKSNEEAKQDPPEAFGSDRAQFSEDASRGFSDGTLDFNGDTSSTGSMEDDDQSSEPLLKLMKILPNDESSILPQDVVIIFEEEMQKITAMENNYLGWSVETIHISKDVLEMMSSEKVSQTHRDWHVRDLILMLHLNVTKSYQKRRRSQEDKFSNGDVDRSEAHFIEVLVLVLQRLNSFPIDPEMMRNLDILGSRLRERATKMDQRHISHVKARSRSPSTLENSAGLGSNDRTLSVSEDVLTLLSEFGNDEGSKLPIGFMAGLQTRLRYMVNKDYGNWPLNETSIDATMSLVLEAAVTALSNESFLEIMKSERRVKDLVLRFHLSATKSYQGFKADPIFSWDGTTHAALLVCVKVILHTLKDWQDSANIITLVEKLHRLESVLELRSQAKSAVQDQPRQANDKGSPRDEKLDTRTHETSWESYWSHVAGRSEAEVYRQRLIHELWLSEKKYVEGLTDIRSHYQQSLTEFTTKFNYLPPRTMEVIQDVFEIMDSISQANTMLLDQLGYRMEEQGPWVMRVSDIFDGWITTAATSYQDYAKQFHLVQSIIKNRTASNPEILQLFPIPSGSKIPWFMILESPGSRIKEYVNFLKSLAESYDEADSSNEPRSHETDLQSAIAAAIRLMSSISRDIENSKMKGRILELFTALTFNLDAKKNFADHGEYLDLGSEQRRLFSEGIVDRILGLEDGTHKLEPTFLMVFDHYMLVTTPATQGDIGWVEGRERFYVSVPVSKARSFFPSLFYFHLPVWDIWSATSAANVLNARKTFHSTQDSDFTDDQKPIPMMVLELEGIGDRILRTLENGVISVTDDNVRNWSRETSFYFPFRVKNLARNTTYTLCSGTSEARDQWMCALLEAKQAYVSTLYDNAEEPFSLKMLSGKGDEVSESSSRKTWNLPQSPLNRALSQVEPMKPGDIPVTRIPSSDTPSTGVKAPLCATTFTFSGSRYLAQGTSRGFSVVEYGSAQNLQASRIWIELPDVKQLCIFEENNSFLVLAKGVLYTYQADLICPSAANRSRQTQAPRPFQVIQMKDVGFFVAGLRGYNSNVFVSQGNKTESTIKIMESTHNDEQYGGLDNATSHSTHSKNHGLAAFQDYFEYRLGDECLGINVLDGALALATTKGFRTLSTAPGKKKRALRYVPQLEAKDEIMKKIEYSKRNRPLQMVSLGSGVFFCCYQQCGLWVNAYWALHRQDVVEFCGSATSAAARGRYILLFHSDFIEIRDIYSGDLRQVIAGQDIRCLDDARPGLEDRPILISMAHPSIKGEDLVLELVPNEEQVVLAETPQPPRTPPRNCPFASLDEDGEWKGENDCDNNHGKGFANEEMLNEHLEKLHPKWNTTGHGRSTTDVRPAY